MLLAAGVPTVLEELSTEAFTVMWFLSSRNLPKPKKQDVY